MQSPNEGTFCLIYGPALTPSSPDQSQKRAIAKWRKCVEAQHSYSSEDWPWHVMSTPGGPQLFHESVCVCFSLEKPLKCGPCCREANSIFGTVSKTTLHAHEGSVKFPSDPGQTGKTGHQSNQSHEHAIPDWRKRVKAQHSYSSEDVGRAGDVHSWWT